MSPTDIPFVFVLWLDAATDDGWAEIEPEHQEEEVWSAGWLIERNRVLLRLAGDIGVTGGCNRRIMVPMGMVVRIHEGSMTGPIIFERKTRAKAKKSPAAGRDQEPNRS